MDIAWGLVIVTLGLLAWAGQALTWFMPTRAVALSLTEAETSVDTVYWADIRGESLWDTLSLWTLPLAGLLLLAGHEAWAWLGLVGGGMFIYFGGRGLLTRLELRRRGHRIGAPTNVRLALLMSAVWGLAGLVTVVAAASTLN
jgi:hypothetical protein